MSEPRDEQHAEQKSGSPFDPATFTRLVSENLAVGRVFGPAYERDGVLVIPVAKAVGGIGAGSGGGSGPIPAVRVGRWPSRFAPQPATAQDTAIDAELDTEQGAGHGGGGGYGGLVRPLGVYVVDDAGVRWEPTLDLNLIILVGEVLAAWTVAAALAAAAVHRRARVAGDVTASRCLLGAVGRLAGLRHR
jgi:uncharacterized spore protein YtfJ